MQNEKKSSESQANIEVVRKRFVFGMARSLKVNINNEMVGALSFGKSNEYLVNPGKVVIQVSMDWCKSNKVELNLKSGESVSLKADSINILFAGFLCFLSPSSVFNLSRNS